MAARWQTGVWLGKAWESDEHIVGGLHTGSIIRSRSVKGLNSDITLEELISITGRIHEPYTAWTQERDGQLLKEGEKSENDRSASSPAQDGEAKDPDPEEIANPSSGLGEPRAGIVRGPQNWKRAAVPFSDVPALLRKWRVTEPMIKAFGHTSGCSKCDQLQGKGCVNKGFSPPL